MIVALQALDPTAKSNYGSKAWRLCEAMQRGYRVPAGVVVPVPDCEAVVARWRADQAVRLARLLEAPSPDQCLLSPEVRELTFPASLRQEVAAATRALRTDEGARLIVRSSAQAEDREAGSQAGQFYSEGHLASEREVLLAVARVLLSSLWRRQRGLAEGATAVLLQVQVSPEISGVAFSCNPVTGDPDEVVIAYAEGACGAVTDGLAAAAQASVCVGQPEPEDWEVRCDAAVVPLARRIAAAALDLERLIESPADIEWAVAQGELLLLQVRPVTTVAFRQVAAELTDDEGRYERAAARPLHHHSWYWLQASDRAHAEVLPRFGERYLRVTHRVINGYAYRSIRVDRSQFDKTRQWECARAEAPRALAAWEERRGLLVGELRELNAGPVSMLPLPELKARYQRVVALAAEAQRTHDTLQRPIKSMEWWVWELAKRLAGYDELRVVALLDEPGPLETEFRERMSDLVADAVPDDRLWEVARDFGYQFASFDELYSPLSWETWEEDAAPLRALCAAHRQASGHSDREARRGEARRALLARADEADAPAGALLREVLGLAVRCMAVRADKDLCLSLSFAVHRKYLMELGARVFEREARRDIFAATMEEVMEFCAGDGEALSPQVRAAVARRGRHHRAFTKMLAPAALPLPPAEVPAAAGDVIEGRPGAAGTATGRVRVLSDIREVAALERGEVMVLPDIKPVWALAFGVASAVITANGHLLAHGAIMAREAGIPCVFVGEAVRTLRTGDVVRVLGEQGKVEVLSRAT
jgi:phosphohistidine swiveling domain-containing protein